MSSILRQVLHVLQVSVLCQVHIAAGTRAHYELSGVHHSHAVYPSWTPCHNGSVSIEFRTRRHHALLLYTQSWL